ncbi:hypothetical protein ABZW30_13110 [Kitasatospora sp. NPDC004669]|uniref:hypothetical protein n=1 Tax=Kitasatospora sp. NPDC004669 TaxID=3154555 RepID=UPI0033BDFE69
MSWRDAVQPALRVLLQGDSYTDPHLELLRLGVEHPEIAAETIVVTLAVDGALVTGTMVSAAAWEDLHVRQLGEADYYGLRKVVREALGHLDQAAEDGRRRREVDRRFLHLRDVTYRAGRTVRALPLWRGPITAVSGWTLGTPDPD